MSELNNKINNKHNCAFCGKADAKLNFKNTDLYFCDLWCGNYKEKPICKRCGKQTNASYNGYCFECNEEINNHFYKIVRGGKCE